MNICGTWFYVENKKKKWTKMNFVLFISKIQLIVIIQSQIGHLQAP